MLRVSPARLRRGNEAVPAAVPQREPDAFSRAAWNDLRRSPGRVVTASNTAIRKASHCHPSRPQARRTDRAFSFAKSRAGGIRTHDLLNPIQAFYQAELQPVFGEAGM
jgi:hypothetical protein